MQNDIFSGRTNNYIRMATSKWARRMEKIIQDEMPEDVDIAIGYNEYRNRFYFVFVRNKQKQIWKTKNFDAGIKKLLKVAFKE
jgi:hypothetical protein